MGPRPRPNIHFSPLALLPLRRRRPRAAPRSGRRTRRHATYKQFANRLLANADPRRQGRASRGRPELSASGRHHPPAPPGFPAGRSPSLAPPAAPFQTQVGPRAARAARPTGHCAMAGVALCARSVRHQTAHLVDRFGENLGAETERLLTETIGDLAAEDALREAGEVLEIGRRSQLAARGDAVGHPSLEKHRLELCNRSKERANRERHGREVAANGARGPGAGTPRRAQSRSPTPRHPRHPPPPPFPTVATVAGGGHRGRRDRSGRNVAIHAARRRFLNVNQRKIDNVPARAA